MCAMMPMLRVRSRLVSRAMAGLGSSSRLGRHIDETPSSLRVSFFGSRYIGWKGFEVLRSARRSGCSNNSILCRLLHLAGSNSSCLKPIQTRAPNSPAIVSERLVRVSHLVRVVLLLDGVATQLRCVDQLRREALTHGLLAAVARVVHEPAHAEGNAPLGADFDRNLIGGTADAAALHFQARLDVVERLAEDLQRILLEASADDFEGTVQDAFGGGLLATDHQ